MKFIEVSSPVKIDKLVPGGQGIGTFTGEDLDKNDKSPENMRLLSLIGKKGFFWNVLPEEIVTKFTITKNKSHYFEAIAEEITNPSLHRVTPKDTCFLSTSPWQIMDYGYELEQKANLLQEIFSQAGLSLAAGGVAGGTPSAGDLQVDAMGESATTGPAAVKTDGNDFYYRNKMEYSLYWDVENSEIKLAQHARGSHRKVPLATSSIERPEIFKKAQEIVAELNANHEEARKYQSLLLRCDKSGKVEGGLFENKKPHPKFNNLEDEILGHKYSYSPNGFFQVNLPVYEMALAEIKSYVETDNVLDLYSGVGTIGLSIARDKHLTLVESNSAAYEELEKNCRAAGPATKAAGPAAPRAVLSNSEDALEYIAPDQTVILDPPRAGCDKKLIEKLLEIKPQRIIYLSCNPSTQARDVKLLEEKYQLIKVTPYNFFPRTPHLENLVVLDLR